MNGGLAVASRRRAVRRNTGAARLTSSPSSAMTSTESISRAVTFIDSLPSTDYLRPHPNGPPFDKLRLGRPLTGEDRWNGSRQDLEIEPQGLALDIPDIELHLPTEVDVAAPGDLP